MILNKLDIGRIYEKNYIIGLKAINNYEKSIKYTSNNDVLSETYYIL